MAWILGILLVLVLGVFLFGFWASTVIGEPVQTPTSRPTPALVRLPPVATPALAATPAP